MVLEQRLLGYPTLPISLFHGVSGQEERHVRHAVVTFADSDLPLRSFRLRVRININLRTLWLTVYRGAFRFYWPQPWLQAYNWAQGSSSTLCYVACDPRLTTYV